MAATLLISEYSTDDAFTGGDFIELFNGTGGEVDVAGWELHIYGAGATPAVRLAIDGVWGSSIPDGRRLLFARSGAALESTADLTFNAPLAPTTGIGIWDGTSYVDAVGNRERAHNGLYAAAGIMEGAGVPPLIRSAGFEQSYERRNGGSSGNCADTDDNADDFLRRVSAAKVSPEGLAAAPVFCTDVPPPTGPPATHLVISEFRTDGDDGGQDEFLEIFNPTAASIWLEPYAVFDEGNVLEYQFGDVWLASGDHFVIGGTAYGNDVGDVEVDATYSGGGIQNKGAIKLGLDTPVPMIIDEVELGAGPGSPRLPELNGRLDQSYQRIDGGCTDTDQPEDFEFTLVSSPSPQGTSITPCGIGADCAGAQAGGGSLSGADLTNCDLAGADLVGADLAGADLSGANLQDADLEGANLTGADGAGAVLVNANLIDADFDLADLTGANLMGVTANRAKFNMAILNGASLVNAGLHSADFDDAQLVGANLTGAILTNADLIKANLEDASLVWTILNGANFQEANLRGADLSDASVQNTSFDQADLTTATFGGATGTPSTDATIFSDTTCPNWSTTSSAAGCWA